MTLREQLSDKKIWLLILLAVLIVLVIIIWWLWPKRQPTVVLVPDQGQKTAASSTNPTALNPNLILPPMGGEVTVVARNFAERFGSYSNQSQYQNILDLSALMTLSLRAQFKVSSASSATYTGVETKALQVIVSQQDNTSASVVVKTQRRERDQQLQEKVSYQDLHLELVKVAGNWLVDKAVWK